MTLQNWADIFFNSGACFAIFILLLFTHDAAYKHGCAAGKAAQQPPAPDWGFLVSVDNKCIFKTEKTTGKIEIVQLDAPGVTWRLSSPLRYNVDACRRPYVHKQCDPDNVSVLYRDGNLHVNYHNGLYWRMYFNGALFGISHGNIEDALRRGKILVERHHAFPNR